jgi:hypothetical protein
MQHTYCTNCNAPLTGSQIEGGFQMLGDHPCVRATTTVRMSVRFISIGLIVIKGWIWRRVAVVVVGKVIWDLKEDGGRREKAQQGVNASASVRDRVALVLLP